MRLAMGRKHLMMKLINVIIVILLLSCNNMRNNNQKSPQRKLKNMQIDSFVVRKLMARVHHIDSIIKKNNLTVVAHESKVDTGTVIDCLSYRFSWKFKPRDGYIHFIELYSLSILHSSFIEKQYYHNDSSYFITDPDGNTGLMDYGLDLNYSFYLHSFTSGVNSSDKYIHINVKRMIESKNIKLFNNIKEWDSLYDAQHLK